MLSVSCALFAQGVQLARYLNFAMRGREPKLLLHSLDKLLSADCNCLRAARIAQAALPAQPSPIRDAHSAMLGLRAMRKDELTALGLPVDNAAGLSESH
jgi:hypothetical protein